MPVVACPCGKKFRAIDALAGKQVNCPGCGQPLLIPQVSLLDEELDRPSVVAPVATPLPRTRIRDQSVKIEGWLLVVLLAGGGLVALAIVATMMSMLVDEDRPTSAGHVANQTTSSMPAAEAYAGDTAPDSAEFTETNQPEFEARSPNHETTPVSITQSNQAAPPSEMEVPAVEQPVSETAQSSREETSSPQKEHPSGNTARPMADTIRLSTGVALAQTLPTGTAMGFSVEYEFVNHPPSGPANFFWVVQSGKGRAVRQPIQMTVRGTLQGFVPQFRPEDGPFRTHIEDQSGNRLSKSLPLR